MKISNKLFLCLTAILLFCCGTRSWASDNKPFGNIPKLFAQLSADSPNLGKMKRQDVTPEILKQVQELTQKTMAQVSEEATKIIGNKVPFSSASLPLVEVTDCVISNAEKNLNECRVNIKVSYKSKDGVVAGAQSPDPSNQLYAIFVDNSDNLLYHTKVRTTTDGQADKSSTIFLQLPRIDLTDFKEIRFMTAAELESLLAKRK